MVEIGNNLYMGDLMDYRNIAEQDYAFVHATQTIHYQVMGWNRTFNKPLKDHPNYILWEKDNRLSLNWVDGGAYLYDWSGPQTFIRALDFIDKWIADKRVLIHCDQGLSRSPTMGLLYLAKRSGTLPGNSYAVASEEFRKIFPNYSPGGIGEYVSTHWNGIN